MDTPELLRGSAGKNSTAVLLRVLVVAEFGERLASVRADGGAGRPGSGGTVFPPGPLGGYLKCVGNEKGLVPACAWADQSGTTIGSVADCRSGAGTDDLASLAERTRAVREAMTHQQK
ncbi:hypothetical protein [Kitasatospora sp. NPDC093102]|uniref:hypothetical protein n=1 Tax=Kitasatospora sp. NPDC093102 TaxID=3155069 RepID=UPI00341CC41E